MVHGGASEVARVLLLSLCMEGRRDSAKSLRTARRTTVLAGIAIRALVETVCAHYGATAPNLKAKVDELVGKGKLSDDQRNSLHGCRCLGNEAAHEAKVSTDEELEIANDIADGLLKAAFIHPHLRLRLPKDGPPKPKAKT